MAALFSPQFATIRRGPHGSASGSAHSQEQSTVSVVSPFGRSLQSYTPCRTPCALNATAQAIAAFFIITYTLSECNQLRLFPKKHVKENPPIVFTIHRKLLAWLFYIGGNGHEFSHCD